MDPGITDQFIMIGRVLLAAVLTGLIGWQREKAHKPAGLRTHMLIGVGAALFTVISILFLDAPSRVAAGVVTGIGFLGAGAIMHRTQAVEGLTTAASIWATAAVGLAVGAGFYLIGTASALIVFAILLLHHPSDSDNNG